jgi:hypothetical protein
VGTALARELACRASVDFREKFFQWHEGEHLRNGDGQFDSYVAGHIIANHTGIDKASYDFLGHGFGFQNHAARFFLSCFLASAATMRR